MSSTLAMRGMRSYKAARGSEQEASVSRRRRSCPSAEFEALLIASSRIRESVVDLARVSHKCACTIKRELLFFKPPQGKALAVLVRRNTGCERFLSAIIVGVLSTVS